MEYETVLAGTEDVDGITKLLNERAAQGWKLVSTNPSLTLSGILLFFERAVPKKK